MKYAPLKSDFVKQLTSDETVKTEIDEDMFSVPSVVIETEGVEIEPETGEVIQEKIPE